MDEESLVDTSMVSASSLEHLERKFILDLEEWYQREGNFGRLAIAELALTVSMFLEKRKTILKEAA